MCFISTKKKKHSLNIDGANNVNGLDGTHSILFDSIRTVCLWNVLQQETDHADGTWNVCGGGRWGAQSGSRQSSVKIRLS